MPETGITWKICLHLHKAVGPTIEAFTLSPCRRAYLYRFLYLAILIYTRYEIFLRYSAIMESLESNASRLATSFNYRQMRIHMKCLFSKKKRFWRPMCLEVRTGFESEPNLDPGFRFRFRFGVSEKIALNLDQTEPSPARTKSVISQRM